MKSRVLLTAVMVFFISLSDVPAVTIAGIGEHPGYPSEDAADTVFSSGDLSGSIVRLDHSTYNSMSAADLTGSYDVLMFTWSNVATLNAGWSTKLLPYLNAGGSVIWEDPQNLSGLGPLITGYSIGVHYGSYTLSSVPGLTDGHSSNLHHDHFSMSGWAPSLRPFITDENDNAVALYGNIGNGRIIVSGMDLDMHGIRGVSNWHGAQYDLLKKELEWTSSVPAVAPEPSASILFLVGLVIFAYKRMIDH